MNRKLRVCLVLFAGLVVNAVAVALVVGSLFYVARNATEQAWQAKLKKRTPAEMSSMISSLTSYRSEPANFLPVSLMDDEACAAAVANAVNFILGEERLKAYPAWLFYKANAENLTVVYDRSRDFQIEGNKVVETYDRKFRLRDRLDPEGMYILGYHYHYTQSDEKIIAAGAGVKDSLTGFNSHVMLLLNNDDGHWWGYHLIHRPGFKQEYPVKVEPLDEMPRELDLVYIWRVNGVQLPESDADLFLANRMLPYDRILPWLNHGGSKEYYVDTIAVWLMNLVNGTEQFPIVLNLKEQDVVELPLTGRLFHGKILAFYKGVPIYYHQAPSTIGEFGHQFQCVEFANRFLVSQGYRNLKGTEDADSYFWDAKKKGLTAFANGCSEKPRQDDLIIFDKSDTDKNPGHIAVISFVADTFICFVQQNVGTEWRKCLPLNYDRGDWYVDTSGTNIPFPVAGWVRR